MNISKKSLSTVFTVTALCSACAAAVLYYTSLMSSFSIVYGHFNEGSPITAITVFIFLAIGFSVASGAMLVKQSSVIPDKEDSICSTVVFVIIGALILAAGVIWLDSFVKLGKPIVTVKVDSKGNLIKIVDKERLFALVTPIISFISVPYWITASGGKKLKKARSYLSFTAILWALSYTLWVYFDTRTINSPIKAILLCVAVADMLFITEDARFLIGIQKAGIYRAITMICLSFGVAFSLPNLVCALAAAFGKRSSSLFSSPDGIYGALDFDLLASLITIAIAAAAAIRLLGSHSYLGEYTASKHEKAPSTPFGEAPKEGRAPDLDLGSVGEESEAPEIAEESEAPEIADVAELDGDDPDETDDAPESDGPDEK